MINTVGSLTVAGAETVSSNEGYRMSAIVNDALDLDGCCGGGGGSGFRGAGGGGGGEPTAVTSGVL